MKPSVSLKDSIKADCERRERERERDRERMSRERDRDRDRDRDNDRRERDRRDFNRLPRHLTASADDPKLLASRVFIGNLPTENMIGNSELEDVFKKYGKILGVNMLKGYGFVQFEREEDARIAIEEENHSLYKGYRIDVKMAVEGRGGQSTKRPVGRRPSPPPRQRDRSPVRDTLGRDEPYARPPARDPYLDRDRDPFAREAYHPPPPRDPYTPGPPFDAMLIVADPKVRGFGEAIERRLRLIKGMAIDFNVLRDAVNLPKALEEASVKKMLYAIVVNDQNEIHRSLTLNVLHGTPQEHRNMPLDDALSFVSRNYADYIKERELKAAAPTPLPVKPGATPDFTPPDKQTSYLLNLLADNRYLTVDELDNVIDYLLSRREKLAGQTGVPARKHHEKPVPAVVMKDEQAIAAQQQELQQKILNILNGSNNGGSPASQTPPKQSYGAMPPNSGSSLGAVSPPINPASINLDNPSVQKALDNLISGGSSLLKNIAAVKNPGVGPNLAGLVGQGGPGPGQYAQRRDPYQDDQYRNDMLPQGPGGGPPSHHHQHDGYNNSQGGGNYQQARETYGGEYGGYRDQNMGRGGHHPGQYGRY